MDITAFKPSVGIITLRGDLCYEDDEIVQGVIADSVKKDIKRIILDFGALNHMDIGGASSLVKMVVAGKQAGIEIYSLGLGEEYKNVFRLTGLEQVIEPYDEGEFGKTENTGEKEGGQDAAGWSPYKERLELIEKIEKALSKNVYNRRVLGPLQGFGPIWEKSYLLNIINSELTPEGIIEIMKKHLPEFQPSKNKFYPTSRGIEAGEIVLIDSSTPGGIVSTGVLVLYADDRSFSLMTPQGHPEAGWVTFRCRQEEGINVMEIQGLASASDPVFELAFRIAGSKFQENIWKHVLSSLAAYVGAQDDVRMHKTRLDNRLKWGKACNVWYNSQIRSIPLNIRRLYNRS